MSRCAGIRADGGRCGAQAIRDTEWCFNHHPDYEEARQRRASKGGKRGGRGRPQVELGDVKQRLRELVDGVLSGRVERGDAAVVSQVWNTYIRAVATELKAREVEDQERRLTELEELLEPQKEGRRYGT